MKACHVAISVLLAAGIVMPAFAADANSARDANAAAEVKLDAFLLKFKSFADDYKESNVPARQAEVLAKARKAIQAACEGAVVTFSGKVSGVKPQKDGSVGLVLASIDEVDKLRGKPITGIFRTGAEEYAEGGILYLKMTADEAAAIRKGDAFVFRGRPVFQGDDAPYVKSRHFIAVSIPTRVLIVRYWSEKLVPVCDLALPKYTCTVGDKTYESAGT